MRSYGAVQWSIVADKRCKGEAVGTTHDLRGGKARRGQTRIIIDTCMHLAKFQGTSDLLKMRYSCK